MKHNFNQLLLDNHIIDNREIYFIVAKKGTILPSFKILVMGLYKEKLVTFQISTSYKLKGYVDSLDIKNIKMIDINKKRVDTILNLYILDKKYSYFILENTKNAYLLKKILKK